MKHFRRHPRIVFAGTLLTLLVLGSVLAPWIAPFDPLKLDVAHRLRPPGGAHWFGTDAYGRDVLSRTLWGGRISLLIAVSVAVASTVAGTVIGLVAGYFRAMDAILMRVMDGLMAIPGILLAVAVRLFFVRIKLEDQLVAPLILVYPCLTAFFTFTLWLLFFS